MTIGHQIGGMKTQQGYMREDIAGLKKQMKAAINIQCGIEQRLYFMLVFDVFFGTFLLTVFIGYLV